MDYLIIGLACFLLGIYVGNQGFRKGLHDSFNSVTGKKKQIPENKKVDKDGHSI